MLFSKPYITFNQGVAVNRRVLPHVASEADLRGLVAGIQHGNTSDLVARRLREAGIIADIRYYPYDGIGTAIDDLEAGRIGLVIKLFPVISWLIKDRPQLAVALQVPTNEELGIAFAKGNEALCDAVNEALEALKRNGTVATLTGLASEPNNAEHIMIRAFKFITGPDNASHVQEGTIKEHARTVNIGAHRQHSPR